MKDLRQLVRRSGLLTQGKRRRRSSEKRRSIHNGRVLRSETLEKRNLLAGGILASQNVDNPYDVNVDGQVSARDALGIVNFLARGGTGNTVAEGESTGLTSRSNSSWHYDVNGDTRVTAADALGVINQLARAEGQPTVTPIDETVQEFKNLFFFDLLEGQMVGNNAGIDLQTLEFTITGDIELPSNPVTPTASGLVLISALFNELNEGESSVITFNYDVVDDTGRANNTAVLTIEGVTDQEIELLLSVRDENDNLIVPQDGVVTVGVDQEVFLEGAYVDGRQERNLGAFKLLSNYVFSNLDVVTPILYESQRLEILGVAGQAPQLNPVLTEKIVFTFDDPNGQQTFESFFNVADNPQPTFRDRVVDALTAFGFDSSQYELDSIDQIGSPNNPPQGFGERVIFNDPAFGNQDIPNISLEVVPQTGLPDFAIGNSSETPALINGNPNSAAVPFSIERRSRTFSNPSGTGFGQVFFGQPQGSFDPATGFNGIGGLGGIPSEGGGVPDLDFQGNFIQPFDAYSLRIKLNQEVPFDQPLTVTLSPAVTEEEFLLLYGYDNERIAGNIFAETVDSNGNGTAQVKISTEAPNAPPTVSDAITAVFEEKGGNGSVDMLQFASDPDPNDVLSVDPASVMIMNDPNNAVVFDAANNELDVTPLNYIGLDTGESATITVNYNVTDGRASVAQTATITINGETDPNLPPTIADQMFTIAENSTDPVGTVVASDPEMGTLTFDITAGNTDNAFAIDNNGLLTIATPSAIDFETNPSFNLTVEVTDDIQATSSATVTVNLTNVNEAPVIEDGQQRTVNENATVGTVIVPPINFNDPDADEVLTFSIDSGNTGGTFAIDPNTGELSVADDTLIDLGTEPFMLEITVTDDGDPALSDTATVTITVTDVNQTPNIDNQTLTVNENTPTIGTIVASDPDGDTLTFEILNNPNNLFTITSTSATTAELTVAGGLDFETQSSYDLEVRVTDNGVGPGPLSDTATITVNVDNVNEAPTVEDDSFSVDENSAVGTVVGTLDFADPDASDPLTFSITAGDNAGVFDIDNTGTIRVDGPLNFEAVSQYTLTVNVTDSGIDGPALSDDATVTITIRDINEAPTVGDAVTATFSEDDGNANVDLLLGADDPDANSTLNVSDFTQVSGNALGITLSGNNLSVNPGANGDLTGGSRVNVYTYNVTDGELSVSQTATITINGVNDPPRARDDQRIAFVDQVVLVDVTDNDDAGQDESGNVTVLANTANNTDNLVLVSGNATLAVVNNQVQITPAEGFLGDVVFTYTIADDQGATDTATGTVTYRNFDPSSISGHVFRDNIVNFQEYAESLLDDDPTTNVAPVRNGVKDADELGFGGVMVHIFSAAEDNVTGEEVSITELTNLHGHYHVGDLAPGEYTVRALLDGEVISPMSADVIYFGQTERHIVIGEQGGDNFTNVDWALIGTSGAASSTLDILASSYRGNGAGSQGVREGAVVSIAEDGSQKFFVGAGGFENVDFAELSLNAAKDAALLTIIRDGAIHVATLSSDDFVVSNGDGIGVQVIGGINDFQFQNVNDVQNNFGNGFAKWRESADLFFSQLDDVL